jgi:hypothetical protein
MDLALSGVQFSQRVTAAKIQEGEADVAAQQEELAATQREADRKNRLANALASQIAGSGTKGISAFEGSPLSILQGDIQAEERATERDVFQTKLSALTTRAKGKIRRKQITAKALIDVGRDFSESAKSASRTAATGGAGGA